MWLETKVWQSRKHRRHFGCNLFLRCPTRHVFVVEASLRAPAGSAAQVAETAAALGAAAEAAAELPGLADDSGAVVLHTATFRRGERGMEVGLCGRGASSLQLVKVYCWLPCIVKNSLPHMGAYFCRFERGWEGCGLRDRSNICSLLDAHPWNSWHPSHCSKWRSPNQPKCPLVLTQALSLGSVGAFWIFSYHHRRQQRRSDQSPRQWLHRAFPLECARPTSQENAAEEAELAEAREWLEMDEAGCNSLRPFRPT